MAAVSRNFRFRENVGVGSSLHVILDVQLSAYQVLLQAAYLVLPKTLFILMQWPQLPVDIFAVVGSST